MQNPSAKDNAEGPLQPFRFKVLTQLANITTKITLYELLKLSKDTWKALQKALAVAEVIAAYVEATQISDETESLHTSLNTTWIYFTPEDMQVKCKHKRSIYFSGYIKSGQ